MFVVFTTLHFATLSKSEYPMYDLCGYISVLYILSAYSIIPSLCHRSVFLLLYNNRQIDKKKIQMITTDKVVSLMFVHRLSFENQI